ncbi:MAG TPA: collagen-like protein, partial [Thermoleophilaceae bacterium]|nr:collagen-like protein [Thermoleophilaceae bacterium]
MTILSTVFVGVVLATSLLAEGSALKRHSVPYASIKCKNGPAAGRARPQGGCEGGQAIVIKPKTKDHAGSVKVDYAALAREMSSMPRFAKPGERGLRGERGARGETGERGRIGLPGAPGHRGRTGTPGQRGLNGAVGAAGRA